MTGPPPGRTPVRVSGALLGAAVLAAAVGLVVYNHTQRGLGLMVMMIPVVLVIAVVAFGCVAAASRGRGRAAWAGLVVAWVATVLLAVLAFALLNAEPWDPPEVAWAATHVA
ncbi:hypothetical protein [Pseudactinotalea sp.]|uniref:hypothetical protein n=1 Tax=Pseudactinotalea sp. TaxID=1926260 RepID=UPI003B3B1FE2